MIPTPKSRATAESQPSSKTSSGTGSTSVAKSADGSKETQSDSLPPLAPPTQVTNLADELGIDPQFRHLADLSPIERTKRVLALRNVDQTQMSDRDLDEACALHLLAAADAGKAKPKRTGGSRSKKEVSDDEILNALGL